MIVISVRIRDLLKQISDLKTKNEKLEQDYQTQVKANEVSISITFIQKEIFTCGNF